MQRMNKFTLISIAVLIVCISFSCSNDNPIAPILITPSITGLNGRIDNWNLGDTVVIHSISTFIDYPLSYRDSNDIYGSSLIRTNGQFSMTLKNPNNLDSLFGYSYKLLFPYEFYPNFFNSDTSVRFLLSKLALYSNNWAFLPFELRNASRNVSTITDSLVTDGDYRCNTVLYFVDRNVTVRYGGISVDSDTVSTDYYYEFQRGWNKIVTTVKVRRSTFIHLESRVNNSFEGNYYFYSH
jgi:hypothetical protein